MTSEIFIKKSQEGTPRGDQLAMAMYGISKGHLLQMVKTDNMTHKWCTEDDIRFKTGAPA